MKPLQIHTSDGCVSIQTAAGHLLKYAGKGITRRILCMRCLARGEAQTAQQIAAFAVAHGGKKGCP